MKKNVLSLFLLFASQIICYGQLGGMLGYSFNNPPNLKKDDPLPTDLNKSKIIFVLLDTISEDNFAEKDEIKRCKAINKKIMNANKELNEFASAYPFPYIIAKKSDCEKLKKTEGYGYALFWTVKSIHEDVPIPGPNFRTKNELIFPQETYIESLVTGKTCNLIVWPSYKKMFNKFVSNIYKQYKLPPKK